MNLSLHLLGNGRAQTRLFVRSSHRFVQDDITNTNYPQCTANLFALGWGGTGCTMEAHIFLKIYQILINIG